MFFTSPNFWSFIMAVKVNLTSQQTIVKQRIVDAGIGAKCTFMYCGKSKPKNGEPARSAKPRNGQIFEVKDDWFRMADPSAIGSDGQPFEFSSVRTYRFDTMPNLVGIK